MYEHETQEGILRRMLERVSALLDKREGAIIYDATAPASIELQNLYIALDTVLRETFADTASLPYLELRTRERGISRRPASCAQALGEYSPPELEIPLGARFSCETLNYEVIQRLGPGQLRLCCESPGTAANGNYGILIPIEYIPGLQTAQLTQLLIPGQEAEDAESLRQRYFASLRSQAFGGNVADYLEKVGAIAGVGGVKVYPVWNRDIVPASLTPSEAVQCWAQAQLPKLPEPQKSWLGAVYKAALEKKLTVGGCVRIVVQAADLNAPTALFLDEIQTAIDPTQNAGEGLGIAPIGHVVKVEGVQPVTVDITAQLTYQQDYDWPSVRDALREAAEAYLQELRAAWAGTEHLIVRLSQLEARFLDCPGILDISGCALNGQEQNLVLGPDQIPQRGTVNGY